MNRIRTVLLVAVAAWAVAGGARAADDDCASASLEEARAMAERAASHLDRVGPKAAFRAFMDPAGGFIDRDLYVFVLDFDGVLWANGAFPGAVGSVAYFAQDSSGRFYVQEMIRIAAARGAGWVEYEWVNPCTREVGPKVSYVKRAGRFIVGVGAYGTVST